MADDTNTPLKPVDVRKKTGLTQTKMSVLLDVRPATVSDWENERTVPHLTPSQWLLLMSASGCTPAQLVEAFEPGALSTISVRLQAMGLDYEGEVSQS